MAVVLIRAAYEARIQTLEFEMKLMGEKAENEEFVKSLRRIEGTLLAAVAKLQTLDDDKVLTPDDIRSADEREALIYSLEEDFINELSRETEERYDAINAQYPDPNDARAAEQKRLLDRAQTQKLLGKYQRPAKTSNGDVSEHKADKRKT